MLIYMSFIHTNQGKVTDTRLHTYPSHPPINPFIANAYLQMQRQQASVACLKPSVEASFTQEMRTCVRVHMHVREWFCLCGILLCASPSLCPFVSVRLCHAKGRRV